MRVKLPPRYEHDCTNCRFLGRHGQYDLYVCEVHGHDSSGIARYGSSGPDYASHGFLDRIITQVKSEISGLTEDQAIVLAIFRALPSLILNQWTKDSHDLDWGENDAQH